MPSFLYKCIHVQNKDPSQYTVIRLFCAKSAQSTTLSCQLLAKHTYSICQCTPSPVTGLFLCFFVPMLQSLWKSSAVAVGILLEHHAILYYWDVPWHNDQNLCICYAGYLEQKSLINYGLFWYHYQVTCRWSKLTLLTLSSCLWIVLA